MQNDTLWTAKDLANHLKVSPSTIRYWVYMKSVPYRKLNGSVRFVPEQIFDWINGKTA